MYPSVENQIANQIMFLISLIMIQVNASINVANNIMPFKGVNSLFNNNKVAIKAVLKNINISDFCKATLILKGFIIAAIPKTKLTCAILEPTNVPTANSGTCLIPEIIVMHSSGMELPMEIMLKPINKGDILLYLTKLLAPNINLLAEKNNRPKPNAK